MKLLSSSVAFFAMLQFASVACAQRPPIVVPSNPGTTIGRLPRGYSELEPTTSSPASGRDALLHRARRLLEVAARTGDSRLATRADSLLNRFPVQSDDPDVLRLRAYSAQHRHKFSLSIALLDRLIAEEPRDGSARLVRAQVQLVQGSVIGARKDCQSLAISLSLEDGMLCASAISLRTGDYPTAAKLLGGLTVGQSGSPLLAYALMLRAEVASRAGEDADSWYVRAISASPDDVRVAVSYARYLRRIGHPERVERLLKDFVQSDTAQLQRTLAAVEAGRPDSKSLVESQANRYAVAHAVGSQPEMRDEAALLLMQGRADDALHLARRNFTQQRDYEDVDILMQAANAAGHPEALRGLRAWATSQGVPLPAGPGRDG